MPKDNNFRHKKNEKNEKKIIQFANENVSHAIGNRKYLLF